MIKDKNNIILNRYSADDLFQENFQNVESFQLPDSFENENLEDWIKIFLDNMFEYFAMHIRIRRKYSNTDFGIQLSDFLKHPGAVIDNSVITGIVFDKLKNQVSNVLRRRGEVHPSFSWEQQSSFYIPDSFFNSKNGSFRKAPVFLDLFRLIYVSELLFQNNSWSQFVNSVNERLKTNEIYYLINHFQIRVAPAFFLFSFGVLIDLLTGKTQLSENRKYGLITDLLEDLQRQYAQLSGENRKRN